MQLIGHRTQLSQLRRAAASGKLAHAYLFTGPEGIGKKLAAVEFVKELFCLPLTPATTTPAGRHTLSPGGRGQGVRGTRDTYPCNSCVPCQKIARNTHPDVFIITAKDKDITIGEMREMTSRIQMHPLEGACKAVIINDADKMNASSANSILKTLEEPPPATYIFLITSRPHVLLPTIVSRCQIVTFSPLPDTELISYLEKNAGMEKETARLLAAVSKGSIGTALSFPPELIGDVTSSVKRIWGNPADGEILKIAERWAASDTGAVLSLLTGIYYDVLRCQMGGTELVFTPIAGEIKLTAGRTSSRAAREKLSTILSAQSDMDTTYNKQLMFEQLLFTLIN